MNRFIAVMAIAVTAFLFVIPARAQSVEVITLSNGPPNIPYAAPGSCTTTTCTWIQAGIHGEAVSDVYLDMSPMSSNYTGSFTLSGPNAANYSISTSSDGTRNVGHVTTASALSAGDDDVTVNAGSVSQRITIHKVSGTTSACSQSGLSSASSSAGTGGTILIPAGCSITFGSSFQPSANNQVFIGAGWAGSGSGGSTFNGNNASVQPGFGVWNSGGTPSGVAVMNVEIDNFTGYINFTGEPGTEALQTNNGWVLRQIYMHDNDSGASLYGCPSTVLNSKFNHNTYTGIHGLNSGQTTNCVTPQVVAGNEIATNNYSGNNDTCDDAGQKWITGVAFTLNFYNNYVHDNAENGLWSDTQGKPTWNVYQNTFTNNGDPGLFIEQSGSSGSFNVYQNLFDGNANGTHDSYYYCSATHNPPGQQPLTQVVLGGGSANINFHDNNMNQRSGPAGIPSAFYYSSEGGNLQNNVTVHDNTINFLSAASASNIFGWTDVFFNTGAVNPAGTGAYKNHYHLIGGNTSSDQHWTYFTGTKQTYAQWQASVAYCNAGPCSLSNPDTTTSGGAGTIDTASNQQGTGCTHVACSGAGIGPGGVPIAAPSAPSIQSISLSNPTFTPNVANGAVGTVSVTMSDGSAFSGTLSITGTNSGGFHLSGNSLEEKASSGAPAGTYSDFNIVATQTGAANSPRQITPTVSGAAEGPFAGTVRSITNRIQAEDFDTGGYGVAYQATNACGLGIDTAYGPDRLNVTPTADLDGENNLKVGCNHAGDWHNYTITVPTMGDYTLSMRVANIEAGAAYHVAVDGTTVASGIALPNSGGYDTFATVTSPQFGLTAGQHVMQIMLDTVGPSGFGGDINWVQGTLVAASAILDITVTH